MSILLARLERIALGVLVACTIAALVGYATFGLHPRWAGTSVEAMRAYATAIIGIPRVHILLGAVAMIVVLSRGAGARWLMPSLLLYAVSLCSELAGTTFGLPFGPYHYTDALGVKWLSRVPALIPLSWFTMTIASFVLARRQLGARGRLTTVLLSALLLVAWDLALDPAMSRLTPYWIWGTPGPYFGMPVLNLLGWYLTGAVLSAILVAGGSAVWVDSLPSPTVNATRWIYGANLALPVGMTIAAGLPAAAAASLGLLGIAYGASAIRDSRGARIVRRRTQPAEAVQ